MSLPRMRTTPEAIREIKKLDPDSAFTLRALRRMMSDGSIPVVYINSKRLVNLDTLFDYLSGCTDDDANNNSLLAVTLINGDSEK